MTLEYAMHGHFSVKFDVFSFGVLRLEIVNGQKNKCFQSGENVEDLISYVSTIIFSTFPLSCECSTSKSMRNWKNKNSS